MQWNDYNEEIARNMTFKFKDPSDIVEEEKLPEIQCSDFAAKEELCFLQSSYKHLVHMILVS